MTTLTTLIPAYKPQYLAELFVGLRHQSFKDFKVLLSDDSAGAEITALIQHGPLRQLVSGLDLTIVRGPQNARRNHQQLLDLWGGSTPLVHFNLDDDVIYPEFYKQHVQAHAAGSYCASVSPRWLSAADGRPALHLPLPDFIDHSPLRVVPVTAEQIVATTVVPCENWLGELSNMVLSHQGAQCYPQPPGDEPDTELSYYGLLDIGLLLEASAHAPVAFVRDHLSVFRQHPEQTTHDRASHGNRVAFLAWVAYALAAWRQGRITPDQTVGAIAIASQRCLEHHLHDPTMNRYFDIVAQHSTSLEAFHAAFRAFWLQLLASNVGTSRSRHVAAALQAA